MSTYRDVVVGVATAGVLGAAALVYDWNTNDAEVIPRVEKLENLVVEQVEINKTLASTVDAYVASQAKQTLRVTTKEMTTLEAKPRERWSESEQKLYETLEEQQAEAMQSLQAPSSGRRGGM